MKIIEHACQRFIVAERNQVKKYVYFFMTYIIPMSNFKQHKSKQILIKTYFHWVTGNLGGKDSILIL